MLFDKSRCRILVCNSLRGQLAHLLALLHKDGYSDVAWVSDPCAVMDQVTQEPFDLVILDLSAQGLRTDDLTLALRRQFSEAELPILLTSAPDFKRQRDRTLAAGANDHVDWPIEPIELSLRVRNLMAVRAAFRQQQATEANLEATVSTRTARLAMLIKSGVMMATERDRQKLLSHILQEGRTLLHCDGATMYLLTEANTLLFCLRTKDDLLPSAEIALYDEKGQPNEHFVSSYVALHKQSVLIDDVATEQRFDLSGTLRFEQQTHYRIVSLLTVPMVCVSGDVVGVLQFMNALEPRSSAIIAFEPDTVPLVEALAAQAAVALENQQLLESQAALMDNLMQMIATAIDAKSPYTGRHCSRVPELAIMLAQQAHEAGGALADFHFDTPEQWHEFKMGAWLHDCGKVTTPEYVIDKATKLETINNRMHEIRTRFEVLLRDSLIESLRARLHGQTAEQAEAAHARRCAQLADDFAFVAQCNVGAVALSADDVARLQQLAGVTWQRHFDDRLGMSSAELHRCADDPVRELPALERLLDDKPRHIFERDAHETIDPAYGFKMDVPAKLYNHGELYNLSIVRGTLTAEERYKINEHMLSTIMMLEHMNFPKSLRRVPEYAGTHHETLTGTGYPRRLSAKDLSIPARIMAIADIFEALTAPDRPYKKPNTVLEAVQVLRELATCGQIDGDLFELFLRSGVYLTYAEKFLNAAQLDGLNVSSHPRAFGT